jgi:hypothetical protein
VQTLNRRLVETDPELFDIIEKEKLRQRQSIVLIASEVLGLSFTSSFPTFVLTSAFVSPLLRAAELHLALCLRRSRIVHEQQVL